MQTPSDTVYQFGQFEVNATSGELLRNGKRVKLQEQPFRLLVVLLESAGEVVGRDELRNRIWPEDTFVDFDGSLRVGVRKLREALGDDAENPRYIETVPKRGYRFLGPAVLPAEATPPTAAPPAWETSGLVVTAASAVAVPKPPSAKRWVIGLTVAAVIVIGLFVYWLTLPVRPPRMLSSEQLTFDGLVKEPPVLTDGSRLYFGTILGPPYGLYEVSVTGGEPAPMAMPNMSPFSFYRLAAIAADSSELLLQSREGYQWRGPLWVVPTVSRSGRRINDITSTDAAWFPDGKRIVYASGHALYVAKNDGTDSRQFVKVNGTPSWMRWSPDGRLLRFTITDLQTNTSSLWQVRDDGSGLHRLLSGWNDSPAECCGSWTRDGRHFVFQSTHNLRSDIWAIRENPGLLRKPQPTPVQLTSGPLSFEGPQPSYDGRKIFAVGCSGVGNYYDTTQDQNSSCHICLAFRRTQWISQGTASGSLMWPSLRARYGEANWTELRSFSSHSSL